MVKKYNIESIVVLPNDVILHVEEGSIRLSTFISGTAKLDKVVGDIAQILDCKCSIVVTEENVTLIDLDATRYNIEIDTVNFIFYAVNQYQGEFGEYANSDTLSW